MMTWLRNSDFPVLACALQMILAWALAALTFVPVEGLDDVRPALSLVIAAALSLLALGLAIALRHARDRRQDENDLAMSARMVALGEMTSSIAHEISQPLSVIQLAADNALAEGRGSERRASRSMDDAEFRAYSTAKFERIGCQVDRAARVLARMRIFGPKPDDAAPGCDMRDACRAAAASVAAVLQRDGVRLQLELPVDPLPVAAPQALLEHAIARLLSNAHEALLASSSTDRKIAVEASRIQDRVAVRVADNGPGIAAENRERVFEPFFTTKPKAAHLGLGLSLAFGAVHDAGGRLRLLEQGSGTAFQIEVPAEAQQPGNDGGHVASPYSSAISVSSS